MIRSPPRFPIPGLDQRIFRTPPEPGTTSPASGFCSKNCCRSEYSSSSRYRGRTRLKMDDSMNVNTTGLYASGVQKARSESPSQLDSQEEGRTIELTARNCPPPWLLKEQADRSSCSQNRGRDGKDTPVGPVLPERAPWEGPRSTAARRPTWVPSQERENKRAWREYESAD